MDAAHPSSSNKLMDCRVKPGNDNRLFEQLEKL